MNTASFRCHHKFDTWIKWGCSQAEVMIGNVWFHINYPTACLHILSFNANNIPVHDPMNGVSLEQFWYHILLKPISLIKPFNLLQINIWIDHYDELDRLWGLNIYDRESLKISVIITEESPQVQSYVYLSSKKFLFVQTILFQWISFKCSF